MTPTPEDYTELLTELKEVKTKFTKLSKAERTSSKGQELFNTMRSIQAKITKIERSIPWNTKQGDYNKK